MLSLVDNSYHLFIIELIISLMLVLATMDIQKFMRKSLKLIIPVLNEPNDIEILLCTAPIIMLVTRQIS